MTLQSRACAVLAVSACLATTTVHGIISRHDVDATASPQEAERFFAAGLTGVFTDVPTTMLEHFRGVEDSREQRRATPE